MGTDEGLLVHTCIHLQQSLPWDTWCYTCRIHRQRLEHPAARCCREGSSQPDRQCKHHQFPGNRHRLQVSSSGHRRLRGQQQCPEAVELVWFVAVAGSIKRPNEGTTHRVANFGRSTRKKKHSSLAVSCVDIVGGDILTTLNSGERVRGRNQWGSQKEGEESLDKHFDKGWMNFNFKLIVVYFFLFLGRPASKRRKAFTTRFWDLYTFLSWFFNIFWLFSGCGSRSDPNLRLRVRQGVRRRLAFQDGSKIDLVSFSSFSLEEICLIKLGFHQVLFRVYGIRII